MPATLTGKVVEIDSDGNLVTDIAAERLKDAPRDVGLHVMVDAHETFGLFPEDHCQPAMTLIAIVGESGALKICIVGDSAKIMLGVEVGADVKVQW